MTLEELAQAAEAAQEKAWAANNAAWAAWQAAQTLADAARILADGKIEETPLTWNPIRDALKKPTTWRQALGDDPI
jgi:hypothetical protein